MRKGGKRIEAAGSKEKARGGAAERGAPFLAPCQTRFAQLYFGSGREIGSWLSSNENVLCFFRDEVSREIEAGNPVIFVFEVTGQPARRAQMKLDNVPIKLEREPEFQGSKGLQFFQYPYDPAKHGREQMLTISFETESGYQDTHIYLTEHGRRKLTRVDPE